MILVGSLMVLTRNGHYYNYTFYPSVFNNREWKPSIQYYSKHYSICIVYRSSYSMYGLYENLSWNLASYWPWKVVDYWYIFFRTYIPSSDCTTLSKMRREFPSSIYGLSESFTNFFCILTYLYSTNCLLSGIFLKIDIYTIALINPKKSGWGWCGREISSGWAWVAIIYGWLDISTTSASVPSGEVAETMNHFASISVR